MTISMDSVIELEQIKVWQCAWCSTNHSIPMEQFLKIEPQENYMVELFCSSCKRSSYYLLSDEEKQNHMVSILEISQPNLSIH